MKSLIPILFCLVAVMVSSCSKTEQKQTDVTTFTVKGEVVAVDLQKRRITIAHEEIPNYMMAMTMPFKVKDTTLLFVARPGDSVQFTLAVSRTESWIAAITSIGNGERPKNISAKDMVFRQLFEEGETLPDVVLTNQEGKNLLLSSYRGKVVAMTFIYTRCPLPDFCIRMSTHFGKIQKALKKDSVLHGRWQLITMTFDPKFDSPRVLKEYGKTYGADFSTWDFVTSSEHVIDEFAEGLDLYVQRGESGLIDHTLRTILIDKEGKLARVYKGNDWTPEEVITEIRKLTSN